MPSLLELDYEGRKAFALREVQQIAEWSDIHSVDEFDMVQNKGFLFSM